jgi:hypothetical protein
MRYRRTLLAVVAGAAWTSAAYCQEPLPEEELPPEEAPAPPLPEPMPPPEEEPQTEYCCFEEPPPPPPPPPRHHRRAHHHHNFFAPGDVTLAVGGGVADFVGSSMRSATEVGAMWDARVTLGTRSLFAFEAGYTGTYNKMQSPVEGPGSVAAYLTNNGFDGDLRINLLPFRFQPYIFGGVGYNHASMNNLSDSPAMAQRFHSSDEQLLVPAGAGLSLYPWHHTTFDARFTYRAIFDDHLDRTNPDARLDQWAVAGRFGYTF